jgi:hypothetical protein
MPESNQGKEHWNRRGAKDAEKRLCYWKITNNIKVDAIAKIAAAVNGDWQGGWRCIANFVDE